VCALDFLWRVCTMYDAFVNIITVGSDFLPRFFFFTLSPLTSC